MNDYLTVCPTCGATLKASPSKLHGEWHDMAFCPTCRKTWDVCCAPEYRMTPVAVTLPLAVPVAAEVRS